MSGHSDAHKLDKPQGASNVFAVEPFEEANLGFFAGKCANEAGAGIVFLGLRGYFGEAGLMRSKRS